MTWTGKYNFWGRACKRKLEARASRYKLGARAGEQVKDRGPGNTKTLKQHRKRLNLGVNCNYNTVVTAILFNQFWAVNQVLSI